MDLPAIALERKFDNRTKNPENAFYCNGLGYVVWYKNRRLENEDESRNLKFIEGGIEKDIFKELDREELQKLAVETTFVQRSTGGIGGFESVLLLTIVCMINPDIKLEEKLSRFYKGKI